MFGLKRNFRNFGSGKLWNFGRLFSTNDGGKRLKLKDQTYVVNVHSEEEAKKAISVEELPMVEEYRKAMMISITKPEKAEKYVKGLLKDLRTDHIGLPTYTHLLDMHSKLLLTLEQYDEAELQMKNCIEHSQNPIHYDPDYRVFPHSNI